MISTIQKAAANYYNDLPSIPKKELATTVAIETCLLLVSEVPLNRALTISSFTIVATLVHTLVSPLFKKISSANIGPLELARTGLGVLAGRSFISYCGMSHMAFPLPLVLVINAIKLFREYPSSCNPNRAHVVFS